jgi:hypothetical protein
MFWRNPTARVGSLRVLVGALRSKIEAGKTPRYLITKRSFGYVTITVLIRSSTAVSAITVFGEDSIVTVIECYQCENPHGGILLQRVTATCRPRSDPMTCLFGSDVAFSGAGS